MTKVLVVSPHPDDAEIGMGATMSLMSDRGWVVDVAVCTGPGDLTMLHSGETVPFDKRIDEQKAAAAVLGVKVTFLNLARASRFDQTAMVDFVSAFDNLFLKYDRVYLPLPSYMADHVRVWEAGLAAARPGRMEHVGLYAYEQPLGWRMGTPPPWFGRVYQPLPKEALEKKKKALACHVSQFEKRPDSPAGPAGVEPWAAMRGMDCGVPAAELTYLIRKKAGDDSF